MQKAMKEVAALGCAIQVLDGNDAVNTGDDSITTIVCPSNIQWKLLSEDTSDLLGYASEIHATTDGTLSFKFPKQCGIPATDWLDEKAAQAHIVKIQEEDERLWELQQKKEAAKKNRRK
jgi:hypothetical protein